MSPVESKRIHNALKGSNLEVFDVSGCLPLELRPDVGSPWHKSSDFIADDDLDQFDNQTNELIEVFLQSEVSGFDDIPIDRCFRSAFLSMKSRKLINPYLVNLELAKRFLQSQPEFHQIIVSPGAGISFRAWMQIAEVHKVPIRFLKIEKAPFSISRKWQRFTCRCFKYFNKTKSIKILNKTKKIVCCASSRLAHQLQGQTDIGWYYASDALLGIPSQGELVKIKDRYQTWLALLEENLKNLTQHQADDTRLILIDLARQFSSEFFSLFACKYSAAVNHLVQSSPKLVVIDTQQGSQDIVWSLAAKSLRIPVAALTYDHTIDPQLGFKPDWLLSDSGRHDHVAEVRGYPINRIIKVVSHRRPNVIKKKSHPSVKPVILYADSYYSGTIASIKPDLCHRLYKVIIDVAREMECCIFQIKFHPLRDHKIEALNFTGLDEHEIHTRTQFIKSLNPPSNVKIITPEQNLLKYLVKTDILLNSNSSAGLEAFSLGIPVIFLHPPDINNAFPMIYEFDACRLALSSAELADELKRLQNNPQHTHDLVERQRKYIEDFYWPSNRLTLCQGIRYILNQIVENSKHSLQ
jgi:hypothetical protein